MGDLGLVDCWRALNPDTKDYTHYKALHGRYLRINYILLQQEGLSRLQTATIDPTMWSDHGPVTVELESALFKPAQWTWHLNESLLQDPEVKGEITQALDLYFQENDVADTSPIMLWEAHKSAIRATLIRIASCRRKATMQQMAELYGTILKLELQHKRTQLDNIQKDLTDARHQLRDLIMRRYHRSLQHSKNFFYIHANKGGKYLARILKGDTPCTRVHKICLPSGNTSQFPLRTNSDDTTTSYTIYLSLEIQRWGNTTPHPLKTIYITT
ncbi:Hypothetical predicted protein [Pelobates cultripes]|uniref:Endonuclease/exonuclease/phosphatase domain-containing protein n=1 Tax=Pelobates cultripes TaxID=61616 RepID=A0AAD1RAN5_PELCU|nr:Hypothetical predicted protein [Pelobates cultripes]